MLVQRIFLNKIKLTHRTAFIRHSFVKVQLDENVHQLLENEDIKVTQLKFYKTRLIIKFIFSHENI